MNNMINFSILPMLGQVIPWFANTGMVGGLLGAAVGVLAGGIYGPLVGVLMPRGKAKSFVLVYHWLLVTLGIGLLVAGLIALIQGQPYGVWYAFALPGGLLTLLMLFFTPMVHRGYRQAEYRRVDAEAFRGS